MQHQHYLRFHHTKQINKSGDNNEDGEIIHKGISHRQFARSFTSANAASFFNEGFVDGALVGGAALDGSSFAEIVNIFNGIKQ